MGDGAHDGHGPDATQVWLTAAEGAELGDMTSAVHPLWAPAGVSVWSDAGGLVVVEVRGELASGSAAYLDVVVEQELGAAPTAVVVDLSGAEFVGVRGIAVLARAAGRAAENLTTLCVVTPLYCDLARQLRIAGLDELLDLYGSVAECRAALARREPVPGPATPSRPAPDRRVVGCGGVAEDATAPVDADLRIAVRSVGRLVVVGLSGPLSLRTAGAVATALTKLLRDGGRLVVDLSALRLQWQPALQVFPTTLAVLGGWPTVRLVLVNGDREVRAAVRASRIDRAVPVARDLPEAHALIDRRPAIVIRRHELVPEPGAPRRARALLRAACRDWEIETLVPEAAVVVSELVSNAVQHAGTGCRLSLRLDGTALHVAVRDHQAADAATLARLHSTEATGRGLRIVAAFSRAHGVTPHSDGKTVWAVVALHPPS